MQIGASYYGSPDFQVSSANQELVPDRVYFYKFSFMPKQNCRVKINDSDPILITPELGFSMDESDAFIYSFIIIDDGVEFVWIGGAK